MTQTTWKACLFGGALFAGGQTLGQPAFEWVDDPAGYETSAYAYDYLSGQIGSLTGDIETVEVAYSQAGATAGLTPTTAFVSMYTVSPGSVADAGVSAAFRVTETSLARVTWDAPRPPIGTAQVDVLVVVDELTQDAVFALPLDDARPDSGEAEFELVAGRSYQLFATTLAFGPSATGDLRLDLIVDGGSRLCADSNNNGSIEPGDFTAWVAAFNQGDPIADTNQNGSVEGSDFSAWVAAYNQGTAGPTCTP
ncbi:MAG: GC-type dockerin domain-anchored protein [Phycisphaerales bacterium]